MTRHFAGMTGSLLAALGGGWLIVSPFALGYQGPDAQWADATVNGVWVGIGVVLVSVTGFALYLAGLLGELRQRGVLPERSSVQSHPAAQENPEEHRSLEQTLQPLVEAMLADMQQRRNGETQNNQQEVRDREERG